MMNDFTTLIELVHRYSPSGQEAMAVDYLVRRMEELGFTRAFADEAGNAVGVMGDGPRQIVLLGHIDTVPGEIPLRVEDDILWGRGSVDAKGPLAAFVDAVAAIGAVAGWQFVVVGAVDEERESVGARHIVDAGAYCPEYAIIGEPNHWERVALGYKGSAWTEVMVTRPMAHTAGQEASAAELAVELWNRIQAWAAAFNQGRARLFEQVTPTLRGFSSETGAFQETATLRVGVRLPVDFLPQAWYARLKETSEALKTAEVSVIPIGFPVPAYRAERNNPLVRAFLGAIRTAGGKPGFVIKTGTADLNIVAPIWNCPAVVYGPGDSSLDHTPQEHIRLEDYFQAVNILSAVLKRLAKS